MTAALPALVAAAGWDVADFLGGRYSRCGLLGHCSGLVQYAFGEAGVSATAR